MMKLIINSLYTNKEIFLRELISNGSDALDKVRFLAVQDKDYLGDTPDLQIKIHVDKENKVVHITDTGIGMSKADLIKHLGTIAKSGTSDFLAAMKDGTADTSNLIGQFGVGFYSAFLVADTVVVTSKHNDDDQYIWESDAASYSIMKDERPDEQLGRGTRISLYLKEEAQDFLETDTIKGLISKYSEFINFDIFLYTSKVIEVDAEEEDEEDEAEEAEEDDTAAVKAKADVALAWFADADEKWASLKASSQQVYDFFFDDANTDCDGDGVADSDEEDEDGDGIPDDLEASFSEAREELSGLPDEVALGVESLVTAISEKEAEDDDEAEEEDAEPKKVGALEAGVSELAVKHRDDSVGRALRCRRAQHIGRRPRAAVPVGHRLRTTGRAQSGRGVSSVRQRRCGDADGREPVPRALRRRQAWGRGFIR